MDVVTTTGAGWKERGSLPIIPPTCHPPKYLHSWPCATSPTWSILSIPHPASFPAKLQVPVHWAHCNGSPGTAITRPAPSSAGSDSTGALLSRLNMSTDTVLAPALELIHTLQRRKTCCREALTLNIACISLRPSKGITHKLPLRSVNVSFPPPLLPWGLLY